MMGRKLLVLTLAWVGILALVQAPPASATAFSLEVFGYGNVVDHLKEETGTPRIDCTSPATTPTNTSGATCSADYPTGWIITMTANAPAGWSFGGWVEGGPGQVDCDEGQAANVCKFQIWTWSLYLGAKFVDQTAPDTAITSAPPALTSSTSASFYFASDQPGSTFQCSLDYGAFSSCISPRSYSGLASGPHRFDVKATDPSGNTDGSPAYYHWTVDAIPPDTAITSGPSGTVSSTSATFEFSSSEPNSTFACSLDGSSFSPCASPATYSVAEGSHTFQVHARDLAGNVDPTPATRSWTVSLGSAGTKDVGVYNYYFSPKAPLVPQGYAVKWTFKEGTHTATDASGMGYFNSGLKSAGQTFSHTFTAAGSYRYRSKASGDPSTMVGTIKVPLKVSPLTGGTTTSFNVTWASAAPASSYFSDVAYRYKPCAKTQTCTWQAWTNWKTGQTSAVSTGFTPTKGAGTYQLRARFGRQLPGTTTKKFSLWSAPVTISVS